MKKIALLLAVLLVVTLAGCKSADNPTHTAPVPVEGEIVEISVVTSYGGDDGNRQNYENALTAFEAESGYIIKDNSGISNEEWKARVMASFDQGSQPDILFYFTGADSNKIVSEGKVVSIDEIRAVYPDYASNMRDGMLAKSPIDGKNYAVPVNGYWEGLFVNKKVLAACGVEIPDKNTTWDEFLADCQKIADKGYVPIAASLYEVPHYWFEYCVFNNGSPEVHSELPLTSSDSIGKNWSAGLADVKSLYSMGFFPDNTTTAVNAETDVLMINDEAAFMIDGSWKIGWFAQNAADINNFTVTYVPAKNDRKPTDIVGGLSMGYFITKSAWDNPDKREACVRFVTAMTTDEVVTTFGATSVTALKNGTAVPSDANDLIKAALELTRGSTSVSEAAGDSLLPNARSNLFGNIRHIVTGEMSAEEAIDRCLAVLD